MFNNNKSKDLSKINHAHPYNLDDIQSILTGALEDLNIPETFNKE